MQEVCSSLDTQISNVIKSESPLNHLQIQTGNQLQPATTKLGGGGINCDKRVADTSYWMATAAESGFINSQPSMAEFLNHLSPESPKIDTTGYSTVSTDGINPVPEYPWMKEKKTSRKSNNNNNQGEFLSTISDKMGKKVHTNQQLDTIIHFRVPFIQSVFFSICQVLLVCEFQKRMRKKNFYTP